MKKRILALSLAAAMVVGALASCAKEEAVVSSTATEARDVTLTMWGSNEDQAYLRSVCDKFQTEYAASHDDVKSVTIDIKAVGEDNSATEVMKDPAAAADLFGVPTDQIKRLVDAQAIFAMPDDVAAEIKAYVGDLNYGGTVYDGKCYGFPYTVNIADALYYNTDVFTEEEVKSLNTMLEKDIGDVKPFGISSSAFFCATWFFTAGAELFTNNDPSICTFDSDECVEMMKFVQENASKIYIQGDAANLITDGGLAAWCDGSWAVQSMQKAFGDKMGCTVLPKVKVGDKEYQMKCFGGVKFYAVNANSKESNVAFELAKYIYSEENQTLRYAMRGCIPTAVSLQSDAAIVSDPTVKAYNDMIEFAVTQSSAIPGVWWSDAENVFKSIYEGKVAPDAIKQTLTDAVATWKEAAAQ